MKQMLVVTAAALCALAAWLPEHAAAQTPDYWQLSDSWRFGAAVTVDGMKATIWTLAGSYRAVANPELVLDVLAGARLFDVSVNQS